MALPDRLGAASQGTMNNLLVGGTGPSGPFVYYETIGGGQGGRPGPRPDAQGFFSSRITSLSRRIVKRFRKLLPSSTTGMSEGSTTAATFAGRRQPSRGRGVDDRGRPYHVHARVHRRASAARRAEHERERA